MQREPEPSSKGSTWALAILLGLAIATLQEDFAGFVVGALLGVLLAQVLHLRGRTRALSQQLQLLQKAREAAPVERTVAPAPAQPEAATDIAKPAAPSAPAPTSAAIEPAAVGTQPATRAAPPSPRPAPPPRPTAPVEPTALDKLFQRGIDWLKGGNPLARIGIVILFFGGAFLAKYAADHSLFPIELRFIALALGALALLIVGWRLRHRRAVYAEVLQGGGIAGLYLTVFAASSLFGLLPLGLAFALMVVIALSAAVLAVAQNALSLAVIGTAGGFLAPLLVSTGSGNHVALFSYYALLNLGVFAVAWFRTWRVLNVLGFLFTFVVTGLWRATGYEPDERLSADLFLILFFLMYVGISILNCIRQPPKLTGYVSGSLVFGLPIVAFSLHASMLWRIDYALAWSALALGAFYLVLGWSLFQTRRESFRLLVESFAALGVIFASLAIPLAFDARTTAAMWAVEGAGLIWLGVRQQRKLPRIFGTLLQFGAAAGYLIAFHRLTDERAIINSTYIGALMLSVSALFTSYCFSKNRERQASYEIGAEPVFALWGTAWWLFAGLNEIDRFIAAASFGCALAYWAFTAMLLELVGSRSSWPWPQRIAAYLPAVGGGLALFTSLASHPFMQWGAVGWASLIGVHYWLLQLADAQDRARPGKQWLHAGAYWTLALIGAWELNWQVARQTAGVWPALSWGLMPALLLALIGARAPKPHWPLATHARTYRVEGSVPLVIAVCLWVILINLGNSGDPVWLPYIPLLNPLDIAVGLCIASLALWWTALDEAQRANLWRADGRALIAFVAAVIFLWLNAALIRTLHHNFGAPITFRGITHSTLIQSALSIFWGVLGFIAMTLAARRRWRYVWIVGASLMVVVVAKLFLVDLSSIGTLARIASFLTVGALLLITGYLAPLPPRKEQGDAVMG